MTDQLLEDRICCYLADHPNAPVAFIGAAVGEPPSVVRKSLSNLKDAGRVISTGKTKGTRYSLFCDEGEAA